MSAEEALQEGEVDLDQEVVQFLVARVNSLEDKVEDLQSQVEKDNEQIVDEVMRRVDNKIEAEQHKREEALKQEQITRSQAISRLEADVEDEIDDVREELRDEQKTRSRSDARIEKRITHLADATDAEIDEYELIEDDNLTTIVREGAEAIHANPYPVHRRVRRVLANLGDWGRAFSDSNGDRVVLTAPELQSYLEASEGQSFASEQIKRVFAKIEELAEDSPRTVRRDKSPEGSHRITIWKPQPIIQAGEDQQ